MTGICTVRYNVYHIPGYITAEFGRALAVVKVASQSMRRPNFQSPVLPLPKKPIGTIKDKMRVTETQNTVALLVKFKMAVAAIW